MCQNMRKYMCFYMRKYMCFYMFQNMCQNMRQNMRIYMFQSMFYLFTNPQPLSNEGNPWQAGQSVLVP